jgi:hypothetical protein
VHNEVSLLTKQKAQAGLSGQPEDRMSASTVRFFPTADRFSTGSAWRDTSSPPTAGEVLLRLRDRKLQPLQTYGVTPLGPELKIARLLHLYSEALDCEIAGRWKRADFFWRAARRQFTSAGDTATWCSAAVAATRADEAPPTGVGELPRRFLYEVLIETHYALYRAHSGSTGGSTPDHRAFAHTAHVRELLTKAREVPEAVLRGIYAPMLEQLLGACMAANRWDRAVATATELVDRFPGDLDYEDTLVHTMHATTIEQLGSTSSAESKVGKLDVAIQRLAALLPRFQVNGTIRDALASLHHTRGVQLANSGNVSEGLKAVEVAACYNISEDGLQTTREKLNQAMFVRKEQATQLRSQLAATPNASLTSSGEQLKRDADRGFQPAQAFANSSAAATLRTESEIARARALFRRVGLAIPGNDELFERAHVLSQALAEIINRRLNSASAIAAAWSKAVQVNAKLASFSAQTVILYLTGRLVGRQHTVPLPAPEVKLVQHQPVASDEPFGLWLFAREGWVLKSFAAFATVLLIVSLSVTWRMQGRRTERNSAFSRLEAAVAQRDDRGVVAAAEAFFATSRPPGAADDERERHALDHYREALARRVVRFAADDAVAGEAARYRTVVTRLQPEGEPR